VKYLDLLRRMLAELCATPASRSRLPRPKPTVVQQQSTTAIGRALDDMMRGRVTAFRPRPENPEQPA
jgi:hypothetical protein